MRNPCGVLFALISLLVVITVVDAQNHLEQLPGPVTPSAWPAVCLLVMVQSKLIFFSVVAAHN